MPQNTQFDRSQIQGWGADLDKSNRPAVPMERTPPRFINPHWEKPEQQPMRVKVFHSIERPDMTPVFGTSAPPKGLSGLIRQYSFEKFSENKIQHWLLLLFADRVNVVEGLIEDISKGHIPNIFAEMGIKSEFKYNKKGLFKKVAIGAALIGGVAYWLSKRKDHAQESEAYDRSELDYPDATTDF